MKVRVVSEGDGLWRWQVVAGNGTVVGQAVSAVRRNRAIEQAERVAGPLSLVVEQ